MSTQDKESTLQAHFLLTSSCEFSPGHLQQKQSFKGKLHSAFPIDVSQGSVGVVYSTALLLSVLELLSSVTGVEKKYTT